MDRYVMSACVNKYITKTIIECLLQVVGVDITPQQKVN